MYLVWHYMGVSENWVHNDDPLETMDDVYAYVRDCPYRGSEYKITEEVAVTLVRVGDVMGMRVGFT